MKGMGFSLDYNYKAYMGHGTIRIHPYELKDCWQPWNVQMKVLDIVYEKGKEAGVRKTQYNFRKAIGLEKKL